MVLPKLLYLSDSTELGTVYTKGELEALHRLCRQLNLYLYLDGARLAAALTCKENDLTPEDLPRLCDAFTMGGTKTACCLGSAW